MLMWIAGPCGVFQYESCQIFQKETLWTISGEADSSIGCCSGLLTHDTFSTLVCADIDLLDLDGDKSLSTPLDANWKSLLQELESEVNKGKLFILRLDKHGIPTNVFVSAGPHFTTGADTALEFSPHPMSILRRDPHGNRPG